MASKTATPMYRILVKTETTEPFVVVLEGERPLVDDLIAKISKIAKVSPECVSTYFQLRGDLFRHFPDTPLLDLEDLTECHAVIADSGAVLELARTTSGSVLPTSWTQTGGVKRKDGKTEETPGSKRLRTGDPAGKIGEKDGGSEESTGTKGKEAENEKGVLSQMPSVADAMPIDPSPTYPERADPTPPAQPPALPAAYPAALPAAHPAAQPAALPAAHPNALPAAQPAVQPAAYPTYPGDSRASDESSGESEDEIPTGQQHSQSSTSSDSSSSNSDSELEEEEDGDGVCNPLLAGDNVLNSLLEVGGLEGAEKETSEELVPAGEDEGAPAPKEVKVPPPKEKKTAEEGGDKAAPEKKVLPKGSKGGSDTQIWESWESLDDVEFAELKKTAWLSGDLRNLVAALVKLHFLEDTGKKHFRFPKQEAQPGWWPEDVKWNKPTRKTDCQKVLDAVCKHYG